MAINWSELAVYEKTGEAVDAPWIMALESLGDATHLKFEAEGKWKATGSILPDCGPDGLGGVTFPDAELIIAGCRFGALIGKLGGSSAMHHAPALDPAPAQPAATVAADQPFAIGVFCLLKLPQDTSGPLFISFNAMSRPIYVTRLKVKISGVRQTG